MRKEELLYFKLLKTDIEKKYKEEYPECEIKITSWRQQEIKRFRDLLIKQVGGQISEKWFYTHIRTENNEKLPRIDTLDLLCRFINFENWENYLILKNEDSVITKSDKKATKFTNYIAQKKTLIISIVVILLGLIFFSKSELFAQAEYRFYFIDADTDEPIKNTKIEIILLHANQSPELILCDSNASFLYKKSQKKISFIVNAQYYKSDTITRILEKKKKSEKIKLTRDDYALLVHIFSSENIKNRDKNINLLNEIFDDNAKIIQIDKYKRGIEIYNKQEFILKMTMPTNAVKNIEVVETEYINSKIIMMRFVIGN